MARQLILQTDKAYPFNVIKLDRKKLYGWKDIVAYDSAGEECVRADIDPSGAFIIPKGGKALGILDKNGNWVERKELQAVYQDGQTAMLLPSSFDQPIPLTRRASLEEFLDHTIEYVYLLEPNETATELVKQVSTNEELFTFTYNYRAGYEGSAAFLVESKGNLFLLVGYPTQFEFIGLEQIAEFNTEEEESAEQEEELDFSMM